MRDEPSGETNGEMSRGAPDRSRRKFLAAVGGTATITGLSGVMGGTYLGRTVLAPESEGSDVSVGEPSSSTGLAGSVTGVGGPWADAVDIDDRFEVGRHDPNSESRQDRSRPGVLKMSIYTGGAYELNITRDYADGGTESYTLTAGRQSSPIVKSEEHTSSGPVGAPPSQIASRIEIEVNDIVHYPTVDINVSEEMAGEELWFSGTSLEPKVSFGTWDR